MVLNIIKNCLQLSSNYYLTYLVDRCNIAERNIRLENELLDEIFKWSRTSHKPFSTEV